MGYMGGVVRGVEWVAVGPPQLAKQPTIDIANTKKLPGRGVVRDVLCAHRSSISGGAQHIMCLAPLAIADRRSPEVRNTSAIPVGERLTAKTPPPGPHVKLCV